MITDKLYVGIDIHSREQVAAIIPQTAFYAQSDDWKKIKPLVIKNNVADFELLDKAIRRHVTDIVDVHIVVDYTGGYYSAPIVNFLQTKGYLVVYLPAKNVKDAKERFLGEENKTDRLDAALLAYLLYLRDAHGLSLNIVAVAADLTSQATLLRSLVLQRMQYVRLATQTTNRLHQYLLAVFPEGESKYFRQLLKITPYYPTPKDMLESKGLANIKGLSDKERDAILLLAKDTVGVPGDRYRWIIMELCQQRSEAQQKSLFLQKMLNKEVEQHPYGELLLSFPWVGETIAATLIGTIKDINLWPNKKKLKKALGVYGTEHISAGSGYKKQGKGGSRSAKRVLYQACLGCLHKSAKPNDFRDYCEKQLSQNKIWIKAITSTTGKMVEIMYHCLKTGEKYEYQGKYKR